MYTDVFLKFRDINDAQITLGAHGIALYREGQFNHAGQTDTGVLYDMDVLFGTGLIYHEDVMTDGFHVNMRFDGPAPDFGSNIVTPQQPKCVFG